MNRKCRREGCPGMIYKRSERVFCTTVCRRLDEEFRLIEKWSRVNPNDQALTDRWTTLVEASDAWSRYRTLCPNSA